MRADFAPSAPGVDPYDRPGVEEGNVRGAADRAFANGREGDQGAVAEAPGNCRDDIDGTAAMARIGGNTLELRIGNQAHRVHHVGAGVEHEPAAGKLDLLLPLAVIGRGPILPDCRRDADEL